LDEPVLLIAVLELVNDPPPPPVDTLVPVEFCGEFNEAESEAALEDEEEDPEEEDDEPPPPPDERSPPPPEEPREPRIEEPNPPKLRLPRICGAISAENFSAAMVPVSRTVRSTLPLVMATVVAPSRIGGPPPVVTWGETLSQPKYKAAAPPANSVITTSAIGRRRRGGAGAGGTMCGRGPLGDS
ncbi:MAG: hypothetical protein ACRD96_16905, partial [Bryobacteraceae bacterium]